MTRSNPAIRRRYFGWMMILLCAAVVMVIAAAVAGWAVLRGSLPQLDGTHAASILSAPVTIERDALGVTTLHGSTRDDVAWGTGFVHAQDRFFQMDLLRRLAAGEGSALIGP